MNQQVWIRGVVAANFNDAVTYGEGYYVQQGGGAWNGIYIYDLTHTPSIGDSVEIAGTVKESYYMTRIESVTSFTIVGVDGTVAAPVSVSTSDANTEQYRITSYNVCYTKLLRIVIVKDVQAFNY